jgi:hypothetical protein
VSRRTGEEQLNGKMLLAEFERLQTDRLNFIKQVRPTSGRARYQFGGSQ